MPFCIFKAFQCLSWGYRSGNTVEDTSEYVAILPGTRDSINEQYNDNMLFAFFYRQALQCLSCSSTSGNTVEDTSNYLSVLPGTKDKIHGQYNYIMFFFKCLFLHLQGPSVFVLQFKIWKYLEDTSE